LSGFATGDGIIVDDATLTNAVYTYGGSNTGTLALYAGTTAVETLNLAGNYSTRTFFISPTTNSASAVSLLAQPVGTVPGNEAVLEGISTNLTGFSVSDANTQATSITVTITDTIGQLSASNSGGGTVTGSGSAALTISGTFAQVNTDLATLAYLASTTGTDTITVNSIDSLGAKGLQASVPVTVLPIAAPTINVPTGGVGEKKTTGGIVPGISITYPDGAVSGEQVSVTVSDTTGKLSVNTATAGGGGTVTGSGTNTLSITGTLPQVNADLTTLSYSSSASGSDTVTVAASGTHGGSATQQTLTVLTAGPPSITAPTSAPVGSNQASPVSGVSISESPAISGETFTVALADTSGILSATGVGVSGSGTTSLSITGSLSQINSDLATLTDTEATNAPDTITINTVDSYGGKAGPTQIAVIVQPPPTISITGLQNGLLNLQTNQLTGYNGISISQTGSTAGETFAVTLADSVGMLSANTAIAGGGGTVTSLNGGTTLEIAGTLSQVNSDLQTLTDNAPSALGDAITVDVTNSLGAAATQ
jgi:hypothetical protein